eukprot:scaffold20_cov361-Prasinococcus_capsulatus_cf.AAC.17
MAMGNYDQKVHHANSSRRQASTARGATNKSCSLSEQRAEPKPVDLTSPGHRRGGGRPRTLDTAPAATADADGGAAGRPPPPDYTPAVRALDSVGPPVSSGDHARVVPLLLTGAAQQGGGPLGVGVRRRGLRAFHRKPLRRAQLIVVLHGLHDQIAANGAARWLPNSGTHDAIPCKGAARAGRMPQAGRPPGRPARAAPAAGPRTSSSRASRRPCESRATGSRSPWMNCVGTRNRRNFSRSQCLHHEWGQRQHGRRSAPRQQQQQQQQQQQLAGVDGGAARELVVPHGAAVAPEAVGRLHAPRLGGGHVLLLRAGEGAAAFSGARLGGARAGGGRTCRSCQRRTARPCAELSTRSFRCRSV